MLEGRTLEDAEADVDADDDENDAGQEADAPRIREQRVIAEPSEKIGNARSQREPGGDADLRPARVETALFRRRVLGSHQDRAAPLAAKANTLQEPHQQQQDWGQYADLGVGR